MPRRTKKHKKKHKRRQSEVVKFTPEAQDYIRAIKEHYAESDARAQRIARVRKEAGTPAHTLSALMDQGRAQLEEEADARTRRRHFAGLADDDDAGDQHPEPTEKEYSSAQPVSRARLDAMVKLMQKCTAKWGPEPKGGWTAAARQARDEYGGRSPIRVKELIDDEILAEKCDSVDDKAGFLGGRRKRRRRTRRRRRKSRRRRTKRRRRTRRRRRRR